MKMDAARIMRQFPAAAEYLTGIYIVQRDYGGVTNSHLASWVGVSGSAVTQVLGRLKKLGLARQIRYGAIALTAEGSALAVKVLRRHALLEHLLVGVLQYPWEKADDEAKRLQGQISEDLTEHLFLRFGSPQTCPHGNPLPGSPLESRLHRAPRLSQAPVGAVVKIVRITEEGEQVPHMLDLCHGKGIQPGARFRVLANDDGGLRLERAERPTRKGRAAPAARAADAPGGAAAARRPVAASAHEAAVHAPESIILPPDKAQHIRYEL
jgi:DtxR family transcriptional regulator, Mn-dependent transcriptional regulator